MKLKSLLRLWLGLDGDRLTLGSKQMYAVKNRLLPGIDVIRRALDLAALFAMVVILASCGGRPSQAVLDIATGVPATNKVVDVFVATTRTPNPDKLGYGSGKAVDPQYLEYRISIPATHKPGQIEYPKQTLDPRTSFVVVGRQVLSHEEFLKKIKARKAKDKQVGIVVHGFNSTFQESLFRMAQMSADSQVDGVPVLFAWPSAASVTGYVADRDAATYSRDALASLLSDIAALNFSSTIVFGHSMGGWLTTEALRQLSLTGEKATLDRLSVILAAPDIDVSVFRAQLAKIGKMRNPITVLVSGDDRALMVSGFLSSDTRVGAIDVNNPQVIAAAREYNVSIVDISQLSPSDGMNHDRYVALSSLYAQLAASGKSSGAQKAGAFVFDTVGATVSTPFKLVSAVISAH